jgi:hypothetical protein
MSESSKPLDKAVKTGAEKVIRASPSADLSVGNQTLYELLQYVLGLYFSLISSYNSLFI